MKRGTTLVEILIVIALLGIVAGVVTPALPRPTSDPAERAAATILRVLRTTRARALREGQAYEVVVAPHQRRAWVLAAAPDSDARLSELPSFEDDVSLDARDERVRFVFGSSGTANDDSLIVRSSARALVISVDPWTGEPRASAR